MVLHLQAGDGDDRRIHRAPQQAERENWRRLGPRQAFVAQLGLRAQHALEVSRGLGQCTSSRSM